MDLKEAVAEKLIQNEIDLALDLLHSKPDIRTHYRNDVVVLQQKYQDTTHKELLGLLTREEASKEKAQLTLDVLLLTDTITAAKPPVTRWNFLDRSPKTAATATDIFSKEEAAIRKALLDRYQSRLKQKTDYRLPITLTLTYTKEGSSPDYLHFAKDIVEQQSIEGDLVATLKKHQHLLIIGNPGAGKTTQLLELAKAWLENGENEKIPVIFNLAAWNADAQRFDEWLQAALVSGYGFSKALAREAIFKGKILPLLDGLDEVGRDIHSSLQGRLRSQCLKSIDNYLSLFDVNYLVICSRRKEYAAAADAPVKATVLVNPLSPDEIKRTLKAALAQKISTKDETAATTLLNLLSKHPSLETVLCTPFYYNIALEVFDVRTGIRELPAEGTALQEYLVEQFVAEKLAQTPNPKGFTEAKTRHYLAWLAVVLNAESRVNFELVDFQPRHLDKKRRDNLVFGLFCGLGNTFVFGFVFGLSVVSVIYFVLGLVFGLVIAFVLGLDVTPIEVIKIKWSNLTNKSVWLNFLVLGLVLGLVFGLTYGSVNGLVNGLVLGLSLSLSHGLIEDTSSFSSVKMPYHRFISEIAFTVYPCMFFALLTLLPTIYADRAIPTFFDFLYYLELGLLFGVFICLLVIAFSKHLILRLCLYWEKKLPLRWVSFFSYATAARILEQDGGQWRFRHQILQDYFAGKWKRVS
ncbi:MAG TPA: NACHT domain-containing protein [Haliscomenobacter sp.]|nr:NACHT domain-containing protein [Haliscomenobacter sp.]